MEYEDQKKKRNSSTYAICLRFVTISIIALQFSDSQLFRI